MCAAGVRRSRAACRGATPPPTSVPARFDAERQEQRELGVLVIANPTGDLPGAEDERERITEILQGARHVRLTEVAGEAATLARVTAELESGRYDVIHYAGHAFFDAKRPGESGLVLADGELTGAHLAALGRLPPLVVFNACESRACAAQDGDDARGDARPGGIGRAPQAQHAHQPEPRRDTAARRRGSLLGTHWPVADEAATAFATVFYRRASARKHRRGAGESAARDARAPLARMGGLHALRRRGVQAQGALRRVPIC